MLGEEGGLRLVKVTREVNRMRRRLKREYFDQRLDGVIGDLRATREVLGEVLRGALLKGWVGMSVLKAGRGSNDRVAK